MAFRLSILMHSILGGSPPCGKGLAPWHGLPLGTVQFGAGKALVPQFSHLESGTIVVLLLGQSWS